MLGKTHIGLALGLSAVGISLVSPLAQITFHTKDLSLFYGAVAFGALLPDIDEPNSTLGRKTLGISNALRALFGHRGFTHSLCFIAILMFLLVLLGVFKGGVMNEALGALPFLQNFVSQYGLQDILWDSLDKGSLWMLAFGIFWGCVFHLCGDMLTPSGVPLLLPFSTRSFHLTPYFLRFRTGSVFDYGVGALGFFVFAFLNAKILL